VTGKLPGVDLAVIAAFTAAGISLINVAITVRATSRSSLQQWRRSEVRPAVARILALSDEAMREQRSALHLHRDRLESGGRGPAGDQADKLMAEEKGHWENSWDAREKLSFEVAQLRIVAHKPVREAAARLLDDQYAVQFLSAADLIDELQPGRSAHLLESFRRASREVKLLEEALIDATRRDLGIYSG
jgi:hypothetical protein